MKKSMIVILWMFGSLILGLVIFMALVATVLWIPANADVSSPDIQRKGLLMGLADFAFPIGFPILALILGIFGKLPGTQSKKQSVT
jgi:hypothetical protein